MAVTPKALYHGQPTNAVTTFYTAVTGGVAVVRHIRAINADVTNSHTLDLYRNGSADSNRLIAPGKVIPAGGEWEDDVYMPLASGDTIQGKADASSKLTLYIGGAEIT